MTKMTGSSSRPNPYVGPRAFVTGEKLFGRDNEIRQLLDLLIAERIVLLYSPSGAGKSSLIQAGLILRLKEEEFEVLPIARVSLEYPALAGTASSKANEKFNRYIVSVLLCWEEGLPANQRVPLEKLVGMTLDDYLKQRPLPEGAPRSQVLIFDQFEEILTSDPADRDGKQAFFTQVGTVLRNRSRWALFSLREDHVAGLDPFLRPIPTRLNNTFRLDLLGPSAAQQAIQLPTQQYGVTFEEEAARRLVDDLRKILVQRPDGSMESQPGPYIEPVQLQVVCYRLWENLPADDKDISVEDIARIGNVDQSLAEYYASSVEMIANQTGLKERSIRDWVDRKLITEQGIRSQVLMSVNKSDGLDNTAIQLLQNAHLVRAEKRGGAIWFELSHDRLIKPIREDNLTWFLAHLSLLQRQAALWDKEERPESLLLRDPQLEEAEKWAAENATDVTPLEKDFLKACIEERTRIQEIQAQKEQALKLEAAQKLAEQRAQANAQLRRRAVLLAAALGLSLFLSLVAVFLGYQSNQNYLAAQENLQKARIAGTEAAYQALAARTAEAVAQVQKATAVEAGQIAQEQKVYAEAAKNQAVEERNIAATAQAEAELQREIARSRGLSALAINLLRSKPEVSLLLSIESLRISDTLQARSALLTGLQHALSQGIVKMNQAVPQQNVPVYDLAFSPDGTRLAWCGREGLISIWDVQRMEPIWNQQLDPDHTIYKLAFLPDGKTLIAGDEAGLITFWDAANGTHLKDRDMRVYFDAILNLAISPDGQTLATSGYSEKVTLWDLADRTKIKTLSQPGGAIYALAWSPNGKYLATGNGTGKVVVWDMGNGSILRTFNGHRGRVLDLAWSPSSQLLASGGKDEVGAQTRTLFVWDIPTSSGKEIKGHSERVLSVAFSRDGKVLASGGSDRTIRLWETETLQPIAVLQEDHWVMGLAFSPKGPSLLASGTLNKTISIYNLLTQQPLNKHITNMPGRIGSLIFKPDQSITVANSYQGIVTISTYMLESAQTRMVKSFQTPASSVALSLDGSQIAIGKGDGIIQILDTQKGSLITTIPTLASKIASLAFHPNQSIIAAAVCASLDTVSDLCLENVILLFDVSNGKLLGELPNKNSPIQSEIPSGHSDWITSLAFSSDGQFLASGSKDRNIILWNLKSNLPSGAPFIGHTDEVTGLAFSPDGATLVSGSRDNTLILWDIETRQPIGGPLPANGALISLAFSQDGKQLASASAEGSISIWDTDIQSWVNRACNIAQRNLSLAEWAQYFPEERYRQTCPQWPAGE